MADLNTIQIDLKVTINQTKDTVWDVLTAQINHWWLNDFHTLSDSTVILERHCGGRLYEKTKSGAEGLWYSVTTIIPDNTLELTGHLRPEYGGPATSLLKLTLQSRQDQTILKITDTLFGVLNQKTKESVEKGWYDLFENGLKQFAEKL